MGKKRKKKKSSAKWFRPVLPVKKAQEKKIWRGECSNVPKKSKSGVGKKKSCVPCACGASMYPTNVDHQQNIFKIGNPSGEPVSLTEFPPRCTGVYFGTPQYFSRKKLDFYRDSGCTKVHPEKNGVLRGCR